MFSKAHWNVNHVKSLFVVIAKLIGFNKMQIHVHIAETKVNLTG